jgi:hypothetical protein
MKIDPKSELKCYGILFCILGLFLAGTLLLTVPAYVNLKSLSGQKVTISIAVYDHLLRDFQALCFHAVPGLGLVLLLTGWRIVRIVRKSHCCPN